MDSIKTPGQLQSEIKQYLTQHMTNRIRAKDMIEQGVRSLFTRNEMPKKEIWKCTASFTEALAEMYPVAVPDDEFIAATDAIFNALHDKTPIERWNAYKQCMCSFSVIDRRLNDIIMYIMRDFQGGYYDAMRVFLSQAASSLQMPTEELIQKCKEAVVQQMFRRGVVSLALRVQSQLRAESTQESSVYDAMPKLSRKTASQDAPFTAEAMFRRCCLGNDADYDALPKWILEIAEEECANRLPYPGCGFLCLYMDNDPLIKQKLYFETIAYFIFGSAHIRGIRHDAMEKHFVIDTANIDDAENENPMLRVVKVPCNFTSAAQWVAKQSQHNNPIRPDSDKATLMNMKEVIEALTGRPFTFQFLAPSTFLKQMETLGLNHDDALMYATAASTLVILRQSNCAGAAPLTGKLDSERETALKENEQRIKALERKVETLQGKNQYLEQKAAKAEKEARVARYALEKAQNEEPQLPATVVQAKEFERLTQENQELKIALDELIQADVEEETDTTDEIKFPFYTEKRVVLYGGFEEFHQKLKKYIPDIRTIALGADSVDIQPLRQADVVCVQTNRCCHPQYWRIISQAKTYGKQFIHLQNANAKLCAETIVRQILKVESAKTES